jgi:hypothetical protein
MAQNIGTKLAAEMKRGGKKTVVLLLLLPISAYFWLPLLKGSDEPEPPPTKASADKPATATDGAAKTTPNAGDTAKTAAATADDWKKLQTRLDELPLFKPTAMDELVRDPFDRDWITQRIHELQALASANTVAAEDPINRLELSGVVVGPGGGAAIIGETVYRVGQRVPEEGPIQYTLKTVERAKVVLERDGKTFELVLKQKDKGASQ